MIISNDWTSFKGLDSQEQMIDFIDRAIQSLNFQILMMMLYGFRWLVFLAALLLVVCY